MPERRAGAVDGEERGERAQHPGGRPSRRSGRQERNQGEEQPERAIEIVQQHRAQRVAVAALARIGVRGLESGLGRGFGLARGLGNGRAHRVPPSRSRLMRTPAASRSQLSGAMPSARSLCFSTFSVGVFGSASTIRT